MLLQMTQFHSFLCLNSIPVCVCVHVCVIFIRLSTGGHLGCFHVLAVVNTAAMNTGMHVTFQIRYSFFMTLCPEWD